MAAAAEQPVTTVAPGTEGIRGEERDETIRIVEYSRFPRVEPQQELRIGFTRDLSAAGMCLGVDECEPVGSMLRLSVRSVDGRCSAAFVGRVVWTESERDGRFWLGLEVLTEAPPWNPAICPAEGGDGRGVDSQSRA
jgi:hypothetical protein